MDSAPRVLTNDSVIEAEFSANVYGTSNDSMTLTESFDGIVVAGSPTYYLDENDKLVFSFQEGESFKFKTEGGWNDNSHHVWLDILSSQSSNFVFEMNAFEVTNGGTNYYSNITHILDTPPFNPISYPIEIVFDLPLEEVNLFDIYGEQRIIKYNDGTILVSSKDWVSGASVRNQVYQNVDLL